MVTHRYGSARVGSKAFPCWTLALVVLAFLVPLCAQRAASSAQPEQQPVQSIPIAPQGIGALEAVLHWKEVLELDVNANAKSEKSTYSKQFHGQVREYELGHGGRLTLGDDGRLFAYRSGTIEEVPDALEGRPPISKAQAMRIAARVLNLVDAQRDLLEYTVKCVDLLDKKKGDLFGAKWVVSRTHTYQGIQCLGKGIVVEVSAYSGRIAATYDFPVVVPSSLEQKVPEAEAVTSAETFVNRLPGNRDLVLMDKASLAIAEPNHRWTQDGPATEVEGTRLCWVVPFHSRRASTGSQRVLVYVDCQTGEVVGGMD